MALVLADRVKTISASTGTGNFALGSASLGYQPFSVIGDGNQTYYVIVDPISYDWEVGVGTYRSTGNELERDVVLDSSSGSAFINFGAGTKDVFVSLPASRAVYNNADGSLVYDPAGSAIIFAIALG